MAYYTAFVDGELWTDVVDDIHTRESWGTGGIIFINLKAVIDWVRYISKHDEWKDSTIEIKVVTIQ